MRIPLRSGNQNQPHLQLPMPVYSLKMRIPLRSGNCWLKTAFREEFVAKFKNENSFEEWKPFQNKHPPNESTLEFKNENSFEEWKLFY